MARGHRPPSPSQGNPSGPSASYQGTTRTGRFGSYSAHPVATTHGSRGSRSWRSFVGNGKQGHERGVLRPPARCQQRGSSPSRNRQASTGEAGSMSGIVFQVETERVLKILAREIYDSPLALLRENVQNAYDAVRMRYASHD